MLEPLPKTLRIIVAFLYCVPSKGIIAVPKISLHVALHKRNASLLTRV